MINIKRRIQKVAQGLLFEQNDAATRNRFISRTSSILADVRVRQGIEDFRVIMDDTNNSSEDVDNNRLNGRIVVVPTRAVEFIAMDFVITNSGVEFP
jgi:phage tail sheath protein FI